MRYSQWLGMLVLVLLIVSCFLPWTYHPDLNKNFTGFFSENNVYGKPGRVLIVMAVLSGLCFLFPRVWAKRINFFICAVIVAYAVRNFIIFSGCYRGICPEKLMGLWLMMIGAILALLMAVFADLKIAGRKTT